MQCSTRRVALLAAVGTLFLVGPTGPQYAAADPLAQSATFTAITHPDLVGHLPGPDGFVGTDDDEVVAGANPEGSTTYAFFDDPPLGDFYSFFDGTLQVEQRLQRFGGVATVHDFHVDFRSHPTVGVSGDVFDVPVAPHSIHTSSAGSQLVAYTQGLCFDGTGCTPEGPVRDLEFDLTFSGFLLPRGLDPELIPGIDAATVAYLKRLIGLAPPNWTAIRVSAPESLALTADNTRGALAATVIGGIAAGVTALVTTDPLSPLRSFVGVVPDAAGLAEDAEGDVVHVETDLRRAGSAFLHPFLGVGSDSLGSFELESDGDADVRLGPLGARITTPEGTLEATVRRVNDRRVDPDSGRHLQAGSPEAAPCPTGAEPACLAAGEEAAGDRQAFDDLCFWTSGLFSAFDPSACVLELLGSPVLVAVPISNAVGSLFAGSEFILTAILQQPLPNELSNVPFPSGGNGGALVNLGHSDPDTDRQDRGAVLEDDSFFGFFMTPEQEALVGCGAFFDTTCEGPVLPGNIFGASAHSIPGGIDPFFADAGIIGAVAGPVCRRAGVDPVPGCRDELDAGFDAAQDGLPLDPVGQDLLHPYTGDPFATEIEAVAWNTRVAFAVLSQRSFFGSGAEGPVSPSEFDPSDPLRADGCSVERPDLCLAILAGVPAYAVTELPDDPSGSPATRWLWETGATFDVTDATGAFAAYLGGTLYAFGPVASDQAGAVAEVPLLLVPGTDVDGDAVLDHRDNCPETANPASPDAEGQVDADFDQRGNACDGDFDQTGSVDERDFDIFLACFDQETGVDGPDEDSGCRESDMNGDGFVGGPDFDLFLRVFEPPPEPEEPAPPLACGLGPGLSLLLPLLIWLRRRGTQRTR